MKMQDVSVLVVDDSEHIRALFMMTLKKAGIQKLYFAGDGEEGVEQFKKYSPSIVFLDNMMPKLPGIEALKQMRAINPNALIIMISAVSSIEVVQEVKRLGASHYLVKPYMPSKVLELIQKFLNVEG
ncbi:MAG: response regulator [Bacteroidota bacterium]